MKNNDSLGHLLRAWRKRKKLSQAEAATKLRVPKKTLQNWEQGVNMPGGLALSALLSRISK